jgi:hypothetical protein
MLVVTVTTAWHPERRGFLLPDAGVYKVFVTVERYPGGAPVAEHDPGCNRK